jgi:hypothetical protein
MNNLKIYINQELGLFELSSNVDSVSLPMTCIDGYDGGEVETAKELKVFLEKLGHTVILSMGENE